MFTRARFIISLLVIALLLSITATGQEPQTNSQAPLLTATASDSLVRFVGLGEVKQLRLELFDARGAELFDAAQLGNLLDYRLMDKQGSRLPDGAYLFLVTIKDFSENLTQKYGTLLVQQDEVSLQQTSKEELSESQRQALAASGPANGQTIVDRLGTSAALLTNRAVNTSSGDTSTLGGAKTSLNKGTAATSSNTVTPEAASITVTTNGGTTNQIAKWSNGAGGILTDSSITETGGNVGIGTSMPLQPLDIFTSQAAGQGVRVVNPNGPGLTFSDNVSNSYRMQLETSGDLNFKEASTTPRVTFQKGGNVGIGTMNPTATLHLTSNAGAVIPFKFTNSATGKTWHLTGGSADNNFYFTETGVDVRLALQAGGNVGIGTTSPTERLHVIGNGLFTGNLKISGNGNGLLFPDGTSLSTAAGIRTENNATSPNVINGYSGNSVASGIYGATIGGGGSSGTGNNRVRAIYGTVGGGQNNQVGDNFVPASRSYSTVGGGGGNTASGDYSTIAGGRTNTANGYATVVSGGDTNVASGSTSAIGGGNFNTASGDSSTVPGGVFNTASGSYSFAAGFKAKAINQGAFVWGDSTNSDFSSTANNQFLIRASGGVGIGTNAPVSMLHLRRDAAGALGPTLTLMNGSGGAGAGASIDFDGYDTGSVNPPTARIQSLDDFNASSHFSFLTKVPGGAGNALVERLRITSSGNVGIGTGSPGYPLTVVGNGANVANQSVAEFSNGGPEAGIRLNNTAPFGRTWGLFSSGQPSNNTYGSFNIYDMTAGATRLTINTQGNVGLGGTTSALGKLDIMAGANSDGFGDQNAIALQYRTGGYRHWIRTRHNATLGSGNAIDFFVNNSTTDNGSSAPGSGNLLTLTLDSGRVGIGKPNPQAKLDVDGDINANNLPGVKNSQCTATDFTHICNSLSPNQSTDFDKITVNVPAPGFLFITASAQMSSNGFGSIAQFNLFQCDSAACGGGTYLVRDHKSIGGNGGGTSITLTWVLPVQAAGPVTIKTDGIDEDQTYGLYITYHALTAVYLPKQY